MQKRWTVISLFLCVVILGSITFGLQGVPSQANATALSQGALTYSGTSMSPKASVTSSPTVGVSVGDWVKYTVTQTNWAFFQDVSWVKIEVTNVNGASVTLVFTTHLNNGTDIINLPFVESVGSQSPPDQNQICQYILPANSTIGYSTYLELWSATLSKETTKTYAGTSRTVLGATYTVTGENGAVMSAYWDKQSGFMLEFSSTGTDQSYTWSYVATQMSIASQNTNPLPSSDAQGITLIADRSEVSSDPSETVTLTAVVSGVGGSQVPDGTSVYFSWFDVSSQDFAGARVDPQTATTVDGVASTEFIPPSEAYWSTHEPSNSGANKISIEARSAAVGGAQSNTVLITITPTLYVTLDSDRLNYEQGEAVTISGQVYYHNAPSVPTNSKVDLYVAVPDFQGSDPTFFPIITNSSGGFSLMPFAGWNIGAYRITAETKVQSTTTSLDIKATNVTVINVVPATQVMDMRSQAAQITALYYAQIPSGPIRTKPELASYKNTFPESMYGSAENLFIQRTQYDPGSDFACGGYQAQVLRFFDSIRFNRDPAIRSLMKGLDYGPIQRGYNQGLSLPQIYNLPTDYVNAHSLNGHHAVVLYPIGTDWATKTVFPNQWAQVFDPWPTQKPTVTTLTNFAGGWGGVKADSYYITINPSTAMAASYPICGGVFCANGVSSKPTDNPPSTTLIKCPVNVLITDSLGRQLGILPNGTSIQEIPANVEVYSEDDGTKGWYFELDEGTYTIAIVGQSSGTFNVLVGGEAAGGKVLDYGDQPIEQGAQASLTLGTTVQSTSLTLADGTVVNPTVIQKIIATVTESPSPNENEPTTPQITETDPPFTNNEPPSGLSGELVAAIVVIVIVAVAVSVVALRRKNRSQAWGAPDFPPPPPPPPPP